MNNRRVYKVVQASEWHDAERRGLYVGSSDDRRDGFIHFSAGHQLRGTLERHFSRERDLLLIAYDADTLGSDLVWEESRNGERFPHLYAALDPKLAIWKRALASDGQGAPTFEDHWLQC